MKIKKFSLMVAAISFSLAALVSCKKKESSTASASNVDNKVTLVYAEVNPVDTIVGKTAMEFKKNVEELTNGTVTIDVQASGVLGSENDVIDSILGGGKGIDISRISAIALSPYGTQKSKLLTLPYTFVSREHYWKFAKSDLAQEFLLEPQQYGIPVRGLFYGEEGFRHFFTKRPISGLADLKNMKLRASNDTVTVAMIRALGAYSTSISFNELYSSLQTGVVDGAEQPITNYRSNAFPEVAPNLILDGHTLGVIEIVITDNAWNKLSKNQQNAIMEAAKKTQDFNQKLSQDEDDRVLGLLKQEGCNIVEVPDKTPWQNAVKGVIAENTKGQEELYQKLLDFAK